MSEAWPTELHDSDEWPELIRKPGAIYFTGGPVFIDGVYVGECGEIEVILKDEANSHPDLSPLTLP